MTVKEKVNTAAGQTATRATGTVLIPTGVGLILSSVETIDKAMGLSLVILGVVVFYLKDAAKKVDGKKSKK